MSRAFIAIPVNKNAIYSYDEQIVDIINDASCNTDAIFYDSENEAKQCSYDRAHQKLLIVQVEEITNTGHDIPYSYIGALYCFGFYRDTNALLTYRPFLPKYRKLEFLKAYVNKPTSANLTAFLNIVTGKELHSLAEMLSRVFIDEGEPKSKLANALEPIEEAFIQRNDHFRKHTFTENAFDNVRKGMLNFKYSALIRFLYDSEEPEEDESYLRRSNPEAFKAYCLSDERQTRISFNQNDELKKYIHHHSESQTYTVTGTEEQIKRWLCYEQHGNLWGADKKPEKTVTQEEENAIRALIEPLNISINASTEATREGKKLVDPLYEEPYREYIDENGHLCTSGVYKPGS